MNSSRSREGDDVNELVEGLKQTLKDEDSRYVYADTAVNALVSAQIKALREDRKLSQKELAELVGTKQSGISRLEKADYATWKIGRFGNSAERSACG
jgi:DNA-binding transcriptional regulator YiaG